MKGLLNRLEQLLYDSTGYWKTILVCPSPCHNSLYMTAYNVSKITINTPAMRVYSPTGWGNITRRRKTWVVGWLGFNENLQHNKITLCLWKCSFVKWLISVIKYQKSVILQKLSWAKVERIREVFCCTLMHASNSISSRINNHKLFAFSVTDLPNLSYRMAVSLPKSYIIIFTGSITPDLTTSEYYKNYIPEVD